MTLQGSEGAPLVLDGEQMKLVSVGIDGRRLDESAYAVSDDKLIVHRPPATFTLQIVTEISPEEQS